MICIPYKKVIITIGALSHTDNPRMSNFIVVSFFLNETPYKHYWLKFIEKKQIFVESRWVQLFFPNYFTVIHYTGKKIA